MSETETTLTDKQRDNIIVAFKGQEGKIIDAFIAMFMDKNIIEDQLVTAIEGGINYWGGIDKIKKWKLPENHEPHKTDEPLSMYCVRVILEGGSIKLYDSNEEDDDAEWFLNLDKMIIGFIKMFTDSPYHFGNMIGENGDAETADVYVQYCLLGEVVYG